MSSNLFQLRGNRHKRFLRVARVEDEPSRALLACLDDVTSDEEAADALLRFYRARALDLEMRRVHGPVPERDWRGIRRRLAALGAPAVVPEVSPSLTRFERDAIDRSIELLAALVRAGSDEEVRAFAASPISEALERASLRVTDPRAAAQAAIDAVIERCEGNIEEIVGAALEVCTGPDPITMDLEQARGAPEIPRPGMVVHGSDDGLGTLCEASMALGDDLVDLAERCVGYARRLDPAFGPVSQRHLDAVSALGRLAAELHAGGTHGLLMLELRDPSR